MIRLNDAEEDSATKGHPRRDAPGDGEADAPAQIPRASVTATSRGDWGRSCVEETVGNDAPRLLSPTALDRTLTGGRIRPDE